MTSPYTRRFFAAQDVGSMRSARKIVPILCDWYSPASVLDVGCGTGTWLSVFKELGVKTVLGIDGPYFDSSMLLISPEEFQVHDLTRPLDLGRRFDLTVCLEVAEHLPESAAKTLVQSVTRASARVVFSAAIPGQGGIHHVNEHWQSYWVDLFRAHAYSADVAIRRLVWDDPEVEDFYAQNIMVLSPSFDGDDRMIDVVHPRRLSLMSQTALASQLTPLLAQGGLRILIRTQLAVLRNLPRALGTAIRTRVRIGSSRKS